jgi:predicted nucleic acid-binding protein
VKVLVDSCVWSLALRRSKSAALSLDEKQAIVRLKDLIEEGRTAMVGPIRQELLSGLRDTAQFEKLRSALAAFQDEELTAADYEEAARLYNLCRRRGWSCGPVDILICAVARARGWKIWTRDEKLLDGMQVLRDEGIAL